MIFVCGCGHSGTSLLAAMLGSHKDIYAINVETYCFTRIDLSDVGVRERFVETYGPPAQQKGATYICEKTPTHIYHLDRIRRIFPRGRILVPIRDPRDVALSIKLRTGSLREGYVRWNIENAIVRAEIKAGAEDVFVFRYEDFMQDVESTLGQVCRHIGIPYDPMMLNYYQDQRRWFGVAPTDALSSSPPLPSDHVRFRDWQIKQPLMERRGRWKAHLIPAEVSEVEGTCKDLMRFFGYDPQSPIA
jgi:hypothetical protein